jgi:hypothetical protein
MALSWRSTMEDMTLEGAARWGRYLWRSALKLERLANGDARMVLVQRVARPLLAGCSSADPAERILRLWRWLPITYLAERRGDYWQRSAETLRRGSGDCEDLSILGSALLKAMGIDARVTTLPGHAVVAVPLAPMLSRPGGSLAQGWRAYLHRGSPWLFLEITLPLAGRRTRAPGDVAEHIARFVDTPCLQIAGVPFSREDVRRPMVLWPGELVVSAPRRGTPARGLGVGRTPQASRVIWPRAALL